MERCLECGLETPSYDLADGVCRKCREASKDRPRTNVFEPRQLESANKNKKTQLVLTTEASSNLPVDRRLGIVTAEVVVGINIIKDVMAGVRNVVGGRTLSVQRALKDIKQEALDEITQSAASMGADAVVGMNFSYNDIGNTGSTMLMLVVSGTAVTLSPGTTDELKQ